MPWHASLQLEYSAEAGRCVSRFEHEGPLRVLQALYPEGDGICHNVLVHPPGGLVGGDTVAVQVAGREGSHGLVTTPGATRFYRSEGDWAVQRTTVALEPGARFEWLPLEALCFDGCLAENRLELDLAPGAEMIGWDITALGLPAADRPFLHGQLRQHLELRGQWLERGTLAAGDGRLMDGPLGLAGHRCLASLFFACGSPIERARRDAALEAAREVMGGHALVATSAATAAGPQVVVVRALAPVVEPALDLLRRVRRRWRAALWNLHGAEPRGWAI